MIDKIYYAAVLTLLTGLIIWAIKAFVGKALEQMADQLRNVKEGIQEVKTNVKSNLTDVKLDLKSSTAEVKAHFDKVCSERQSACNSAVGNRISRLEGHGHVGLKGDDAKITSG